MAGAEIVTLLFTDLVGSTQLFQRLGDDLAEEVRLTHFRLLREAVSARGGHEVKNLGDGLMVVFPSAVDAIASAVAIQQAVADHNKGETSHAFHVRVGLHVGEPIRDQDDYFGTAVIVAKRLCDSARGGQILASQLVSGLVGSRGGFRFRSVGRLRLKGITEPTLAVEVEWEAGKAERAPSPARARPAPAPGPVMVGRDTELAAMENELRRAGAGELRCLLLLGDPGVGKTRLAGELLARHRDDVAALTARAYPFGETTPFGLWSEALESHLRSLDSGEVAELCGGFLDDLAGILHSVAAVRGSAPEREPPKVRLLEGLASMLRNLAGSCPLVIVLDDVHLADASSWEALQFLAHHLASTPALLVVTARPVELAQRGVANQVLFALEQEGFLERIALAPLDDQAVAALAESVLGTVPPPSLTAWLVDRSRGNSLFAHGLLRALLEEGADLAAPLLRRLPENLADRVRTRLGDLDAPAVDILELLSVIGRRAELSELWALSERADEDLEEVLARLSRSRLVTDEERGHELIYEIGHPLVQEAIYQNIAGPRRRRLHRSVARHLLAAGRLAEAAPHFARSAAAGDREAVDVLCDAVRQAEERGAYREALAVLGALVDILPEGDERWLSVLDAMASQAQWVIDHRADVQAPVGVRALRAIDRVLEGTSDLVRRATVKSRLASFLGWGTGDYDEAERCGRQAAELFEQAGEAQRMRLAQLEVAYVPLLRGDIPAFLARTRAVSEAAEAAGDRVAMTQAVGVYGSAEFYAGHFAEAEAALRRAVALAEEEGNLYRLTWTSTVLGWTLGWEGRIEEGLTHFEKARAVNPAWRESNTLEIEASVRWLGGEFDTTVDKIREAMVWNTDGMSRRRAYGPVFAALSAVETGSLGEARGYIEMVRTVLGDVDFAYTTRGRSWAEGLLAWREGRKEDCLSAYEWATTGLVDLGALPFAACPLADLAEVRADLGDPRGAGDAAARLASIAEQIDRPFYHGLAALAVARAELAAGHLPEAAEAAETAVTRLDGTGARCLNGQAFDVLGRSRTGIDRAGAVDAYQQAGRLFEACRAQWRQERVVDALRRLRGRGGKAAAALLGPGSLTSRERQVARLAAEGLTAREIAKQLVLGQRTVEGHLAQVYAKLGVRSKVELVRRGSELDL